MSNTLICSIELSKTAGVTVKVQNDAGQITQTIVMDGTTLTMTVKGAASTTTITQDEGRIVHEVKGPAQTSTVTQVQEKISLKAQVIELGAKVLLISCSQNMSCEAGGTMSMKSTGDMTHASQGSWAAQSTGAMKLDSSASLVASAVADAKLSGQNTNVEALSKLTVKAGTDAEMSAIKVAISGTAKADLAAPMTTVGQDLTTVKGTLVKVEGGLIKLG